MMNVEKAIRDRRSIRKYKSEEVSEEIVNELLEAARLAPSGNNAQPWRFKVINNKTIIERLREEGIFKQDFVYNAPLIIVCCADPEAYPKAKFESGFDDPYEERAGRDVTIASQNLILRATELGLGTCYVGWMNKPRAKEVLGIPVRFVVPYVITVGYPDEAPDARERKDKEEVVL